MEGATKELEGGGSGLREGQRWTVKETEGEKSQFIQDTRHRWYVKDINHIL